MRLPQFLRPLTPLARWKRWLLEALIILAVLVGISLWQNRGLPDGMAPPLMGVLTDGRPVKVGAGETASSAATLVAFWSTWCPVCKAEEDNIASVAKGHRVISVAMQSGDAATVITHLKERGIELPALVDADGHHAANWHVRGVPTHFIVDATGIVRFRVVGYATTWGLKARLWWAENFKA
jgi:thiol-disulfide isomerase/thioredoxin